MDWRKKRPGVEEFWAWNCYWAIDKAECWAGKHLRTADSWVLKEVLKKQTCYARHYLEAGRWKAANYASSE